MRNFTCTKCEEDWEEDDDCRYATCPNCCEHFDLVDDNDRSWNHDLKEGIDF